jgi:ABC-type nitrate/sulfonate/bicarbonate transport system permease component
LVRASKDDVAAKVPFFINLVGLTGFENAFPFRMSHPAVLGAYLLAGLRLAAGRALVGAVVAEFFTAIPGLGYYVVFQARTFHHNEAFVAVLMLAAAGVLFETALKWVTARFLPWYRRAERG